MSMTALDLPPEALKRYRPIIAILHRNNAAMRARVANRRRRAIQTARKAADLLRQEYGAKKIALFGSLVRRGDFTLWSDIDLAAQGIPPERFYEAVGAVTGISPEFKIDLVDMGSCSLSLRKNIDEEGKLL
jgi:predicted nucleotidyltransferase